MINKCKSIKQYPIIIGIIGILIIACFLLIEQKHYTKRQIETVASNDDYERERNVTIRTPAEAMLYFWKAVQKADVDQVMRIFPISYLAQKTDLNYYIEENGVFYADLTVAPTLNYRKYFAVASAEVAGKYAEKYLSMKDELGDFKGAEILEMKYIEMTESETEEIEGLLKGIGANEICYYDNYYEMEGDIYKIKLTVVNYGKEWLIYDIGKSERSNRDEMESQQNYDSATGKKVKHYGKIRKKYKEILEDGKALCGSNYVWSNAVYGDTPEALMEEFIRCLQRENVDALLTLGNPSLIMRDIGKIDENQLINRGVYAEQLKYFYYSLLLGQDTASVKSLDDLELEASEIISKLKPQYFFYTELVKMIPQSDDIYTIIFKYEGKYFEFEFEFIEFEQGWQIYNIGNVTVYSPEEYSERITHLEN